MKCERVQALLSTGASKGFLSRLQVKRHIRQCPQCASVARDIAKLDQALADFGKIVPLQSLRSRVLGMASEQRWRSSVSPRRVWQLIFVSAAVLAVASFGVYFGNPRLSEAEAITKAVNEAKVAHVQLWVPSDNGDQLHGEIWLAEGSLRVDVAGQPSKIFAKEGTYKLSAKTNAWEREGNAQSVPLSDALVSCLGISSSCGPGVAIPKAAWQGGSVENGGHTITASVLMRSLDDFFAERVLLKSSARRSKPWADRRPLPPMSAVLYASFSTVSRDLPKRIAWTVKLPSGEEMLLGTMVMEFGDRASLELVREKLKHEPTLK